MPIPYCVSLIIVTVTSHIFTNIFQMVHFPAVKFTRGNKKITSFLLTPKSPKVWEKSEVIRPSSFNEICGYNYVCHILSCKSCRCSQTGLGSFYLPGKCPPTKMISEFFTRPVLKLSVQKTSGWVSG